MVRARGAGVTIDGQPLDVVRTIPAVLVRKIEGTNFAPRLMEFLKEIEKVIG